MHELVSILVPIIIVVVVGLIILAINSRFSPDPLITTIVNYVVYALILLVCVVKLLPLLA